MTDSDTKCAGKLDCTNTCKCNTFITATIYYCCLLVLNICTTTTITQFSRVFRINVWRESAKAGYSVNNLGWMDEYIDGRCNDKGMAIFAKNVLKNNRF